MLKELIKTDVQDIFLNNDDFGVTVVYNSNDGSISEKTIKAVKRDVEREQFADVGVRNEIEWLVAVDDIPNPEVYDTIAFGGTTYRVIPGGIKNGCEVGIWELTTEFERRSRPGNV